MIKFFRKIRQNLLSEGKTGKYFKYAIGEIILVVIGILIALSINNWNENRKLNNKTQVYLKLLLEDFNQESLKVNSYLKESNEYVLAYEDYEENFSKSNWDFEEVSKELSSLRVSSTTPIYGINTIDVLKATGDIQLISPEIRKKLIELNRFEEYLNHIGQRNKTIFSTLTSEVAQLGWTGVANRFNQNTIIGKVWADVKTDEYKLRVLLAVESNYRIRYNNEQNRIDLLTKWQEDVDSIKMLIKQELDPN